MREELVTESIEKHLDSSGWSIIAVDYPTSGSGLRIHPNDRPLGTKHSGSLVPDMVVHKGGTLLIVENKPHFAVKDAQKLNRITAGEYDESLRTRITSVNYDKVETALGFPAICEADIRWQSLKTVNRLYLVESDQSVREKEVR